MMLCLDHVMVRITFDPKNLSIFLNEVTSNYSILVICPDVGSDHRCICQCKLHDRFLFLTLKDYVVLASWHLSVAALRAVDDLRGSQGLISSVFGGFASRKNILGGL